MFERFSDRTRRVLVLARQQAFRLRHDRLDVVHLLLGMLEDSRNSDGVAARLLGIDLDRGLPLAERLAPPGEREIDARETLPFSQPARALFVRATAEADAAHHPAVEVEHFVLALALDEDNAVAQLVAKNGRPLDQIRRDARDLVAPRTAESDSGESAPRRTPALDGFCHDLLTRAREGRLDPFIGRERDLERLYAILLRHRDGNALLVGPPGCGKTALVRGLAIAITEGAAPTPLLPSRLLAVNGLSLLAGARYRGQLEERVKAVLYEARKLGSVILFIDDAQALLGVEGASSASLMLDAPGAGFLSMLKAAFDSGETRFILSIDSASRDRLRILHPSAERHLQEVALDPLDEHETIEALRAMVPQLEAHHDLRIDSAALGVAARAGDPERALPGRAVDLLDHACAEVALSAAEPSAELREIDAEIARLEGEEVDHVKSREYIKAAAGREALESLQSRRSRILGDRRGQRVVDAARVEVAARRLHDPSRAR